jgi:hypothetical protein
LRHRCRDDRVREWSPAGHRGSRRAAAAYACGRRRYDSLFLGRQDCRARSFRPHGNVVDKGPFAPLGDCLVVQPILCRKLFERSLRSLYRSSDGVRGRGAAMKYPAHSASRNAGSVCLIPSHSGTEHLSSVGASATATQRADCAQYAKLPELLQRRSVILNASASGISCTPAVGSALLAHAGSGLADTVNHHPAGATAHTSLRDRTVRLMQRRERHCMCTAS